MRNKTNGMDVHINIKRFLTRNWFMCLWRPTRVKICRVESANWRPRGADGTVPVWRPAASGPRQGPCLHLSPKAGKSQYPSSKVARHNEFLFRGRTAFGFHP